MEKYKVVCACEVEIKSQIRSMYTEIELRKDKPLTN